MTEALDVDRPKRDTLRGHARGFYRVVRDAPLLDMVAILSLCLLIFHGFPSYYASYFGPAVVIMAVPAIIYHPILRHPLYWLVLALGSGFVVFYAWYPVDNHKFLLFYWTGALACVFFAAEEDQKDILVKSARFFIIFVMGTAALQKIIQPSYLDSSFFEFMLLTDGRFQSLVTFLGGDEANLTYNREALVSLRYSYLHEDIDSVQLQSSESIKALAFFITWWDLIVQLAMAVAFLIATRSADIVGHTLMLVFIVTTYLPAPVIGFGWTLAILGYVVAAPRFRVLALCYFAALFLLTIYEFPWGAISRRLF